MLSVITVPNSTEAPREGQEPTVPTQVHSGRRSRAQPESRVGHEPGARAVGYARRRETTRQLDTCHHSCMRSVTEVVEAAGTGPFEAEVFGTTDPSMVAEVLSSLTLAATGSAVRGGRWYRSSVAAVAAVILDGGREVVTRAYRPSTNSAFVDGVVRVQTHLARRGYPCAEPLAAPVVVDDILGRAESLLVDPGPRRFGRHEMAQSAHGLADLVRLVADIESTGLDANPMALPNAELYPPPHSPLFDFAATASGAEWIDEIAIAARGAITAGDDLISHFDWSARNIRLGPAGVVCAYDWESLQCGPESTAVGVAAATWQSRGLPKEPPAPSATEIENYIQLYEGGRGRKFSADERRSARSAAVFTLAYTARCEHALEPGNRRGRASARLAHDDGWVSLIS